MLHPYLREITLKKKNVYVRDLSYRAWILQVFLLLGNIDKKLWVSRDIFWLYKLIKHLFWKRRRRRREARNKLFLPISKAFCRSRRNEQHWVKGLISRHWSKVPIYNERRRRRGLPSARRNYGWVVVLTSWANSGKSKVDGALMQRERRPGRSAARCSYCGTRGGEEEARESGAKRGRVGRRVLRDSLHGPACTSRRPAVDLDVSALLARIGSGVASRFAEIGAEFSIIRMYFHWSRENSATGETDRGSAGAAENTHGAIGNALETIIIR